MLPCYSEPCWHWFRDSVLLSLIRWWSQRNWETQYHYPLKPELASISAKMTEASFGLLLESTIV